jgi:sec-independent protein translocase protein TatC
MSVKRAKQENPKGEMPFLDHLEELRWRIFKALGALGIGILIGLVAVFQLPVMDVLLNPLNTVIGSLESEGATWLGTAASGRLMFTALAEPFFFILKIGLLSGVILSSPFVIYQVWAFLSPALEDHERRAIIPSLYLGLVLFSLGVALAYFVALPVTIRFLLLFGADYFMPMLTAGSYLAFVVRLMLAFGVAFELPVVVMILSAMGLVTPSFLRAKRRHAIVIITVAAAVLSPGDVITVTLLLMVPLVLLYEFSILLSSMIHRKKDEQRIHETSEPPEMAVERGE